jgi:hypothetical protein
MNLEIPRFKRSQITAALWRYQATVLHHGRDDQGIAGDVPKVFESRVKKLLDLDRQPDKLPWPFRPTEHWAFFDGPGGGHGIEDLFSAQHAFLLALGLDLVNQGIKQSEAVVLLRQQREKLIAAFDFVHERGAGPSICGDRQRRRFIPETSTAAPIRITDSIGDAEDRTVWAVIRRFEATEVFPMYEKSEGRRPGPLFMQPDILVGLEAVKDRLFISRNSYRQVMLVEVADLAVMLPKYLEEAPIIRRGRKPGPRTGDKSR